MPLRLVRPTALTLITALWLVGRAAADDLFTFTATGNGTNTITVDGSDLPDLTEALIETADEFSGLSGQNVEGVLDYAGVANAARVSVNAAGTTATLEFPITGFSRTFVGTDADDLADQIEDFVQNDGADVYADFLEALTQQTVVGVLDGNPYATTALLARHTFDLYGVGMTGPHWANPRRLAGGRDNVERWFSASPRYAALEANQYEGYNTGGEGAGGFNFGDFWGIAFGGTFQFVELEDTEIFTYAGHVALPLNLVPASSGFGWTVTPFFTFGAGGSLDAAAGGAFLGGGVASNVQVPLGDRASLNWGTQYVLFDGQDVPYEDYEFKTNLSQEVVGTGVIATVMLNPQETVFVEAGASYFAFLDEAAVDYWLAPEVGLGVKFSGMGDSRLSLAYKPLFGNADYEAHAIQANFVLGF